LAVDEAVEVGVAPGDHHVPDLLFSVTALGDFDV
jgi:hypothetical protein